MIEDLAMADGYDSGIRWERRVATPSPTVAEQVEASNAQAYGGPVTRRHAPTCSCAVCKPVKA